MPRVPQYQPHQASPVETTPARLRTTDNSFGIAGGIAAGLPRLAQALQDHGTREEEELRRDDAYARDLALGLQRDIGSLARDFAGLSGKAAADAGAEAKARILALESAALDQASSPRMRTMLEELSAGPLAQALDLVASHSRRGLRQMGGEAARGERDLAIEGALAAQADPAAMARARRQVIEANARLAEAEEWDEARFGEENARTLSDMHTRMVRAVLDDGGDLDLAGAYFEANRDEMAPRDITLTEAALRGPRELADTARVVDEAIAASTIEPGDTDAPFDLTGTIRHIKARTDLSEAQRQNALAQARKRHSLEQAALSEKHEAGRKAFDRWAEQADFDRDLYVQDGEVPASILWQLSPIEQANLEMLRTTNLARLSDDEEIYAKEEFFEQQHKLADQTNQTGWEREFQNLAPGRPFTLSFKDHMPTNGHYQPEAASFGISDEMSANLGSRGRTSGRRTPVRRSQPTPPAVANRTAAPPNARPSTPSENRPPRNTASAPPRWSSLDNLIFREVQNYNRENGLEITDERAVPFDLILAMVAVEAGYNKKAYQKDPMQVNNNFSNDSTDWVDEKEALGLTRGVPPGQQLSIRAGIRWLVYKAYRHDDLGRPVEFRGWLEAADRYNGGGNPRYLEKIRAALTSIRQERYAGSRQ
ncbi:hypothetical protein GRI97_06025 [Altererythrobacter xixiisoli]|uniref:Transglycosylase SLT domain-containing protein n=1 Tax=Croceibacterium xixiisoli TaxID=1476466 RepID=A0A6I4TRL6_9SPHN|nr:hypothetical protein [Croceibacterium xixiisoli]MXO98542.1 hypothetical protein [Croceibacterium xixiisoli]